MLLASAAPAFAHVQQRLRDRGLPVDRLCFDAALFARGLILDVELGNLLKANRFGYVTLAILVTPIFNSARGSLLLPILFHWQLINPFWPDAQPWDTWIFVVVTAAVVWLKRETMFSREGAVTEVIPSEERT